MAEIKEIGSKAKTFDPKDGNGLFKVSANVEKFGENQNQYNALLVKKIEELVERICAVEEDNQKNKELLKRIANELVSFKTELDRLRLTAKLNTGAIDRLDKAIKLAKGDSNEEELNYK